MAANAAFRPGQINIFAICSTPPWPEGDGPDERCADCGEPLPEGLTKRCAVCAAADSARLALELATRLGTKPALRRAFRASIARARRVLDRGGRP